MIYIYAIGSRWVTLRQSLKNLKTEKQIFFPTDKLQKQLKMKQRAVISLKQSFLNHPCYSFHKLVISAQYQN